MPLLHRPADEGILLAQVEDVVLVDPRRNDEQRAPYTCSVIGVYWMSCMRSSGDHLAGRGGDVAAELERALVGHRDAQLPAALLDVGEQVVQTAHQVLSAARHRLAQHLRDW